MSDILGGQENTMFTENKYPILEFDDNKVAKLNPSSVVDRLFETDKLIITFFPEVLDKLIDEGKITLERTIGGENPVLMYRFIEVGQLLVVDGAIRDEGFSYHYIEPSRYIFTNPETTEKITQYLENNSISYIRGLTWTTDALFRETADRIERTKKEGAKIVEMEQAGCIAVSQFRSFEYGALIYGGDDVSQDEWSDRGWRSREGIRYDLVTLCKKPVQIL